MKLRRIAVLIVTATVVLGAVSAIALGEYLARPRQSSIGPPPPDLAMQSVSMNSASGSTLYGWFIAGDAGRGGILLVHGLGADRRQMLARARFLNRAGYAALMIDLQAHGESAGKQVTFGYLESRDVEAALAYLRERLGNQPVGAIGVSLGGASIVLSAMQPEADAVVLEAVFPTFAEAVENRISMRVGSWGRHLSQLLLWQVKPRLRVEPARLSPISRISSVESALLLIYGSRDRRTTPEQSRRLFERAAQPKALWQVEGARHEDFHAYDRAGYEARVLRFFERHLGAGVPSLRHAGPSSSG